jgi:phosphoglycolate/pyridoxal phosphate phosphatase family enzyme
MARLDRLTKPALEAALGAFRAFVFDLEGVVLKEGAVLPGAAAFLHYLQQRKPVFVFTNSTGARDAWLQRLRGLGLDVPRSNLFTSGFVAAQYAKSRGVKCVFGLGSYGLTQELQEAGLEVVSGPEGDSKKAEDARPEGEVDAVVVGFDSSFNAYKLAKAGYFLRRPECLLIGTSPERKFRQKGVDLPAAGTQLQAIEYFTQRKADVIVGKPHQFLVEYLKDQRLSFLPRETLMVGDRLDTDMEFARRAGMSGLLVLSGDSTEQQAADKPPTYVAASLGSLSAILT